MTIYRFRGVEISDRYIELFTAFAKLCDYINNKPVDFLSSDLNIFYYLVKDESSNDYSRQLKYLRYEIPMSRFLDD